jgi:hypothetical protein
MRTHRAKTVVALSVVVTLLTGCATLEKSVPDSYNGPTAKVKDSMQNSDTSKGDFCVLTALDGRRIAQSIDETRQRGQGKGLTLYPWVTDRRVPAQPTKASLRCETVYAAPVLAMVGTSYKVEVTVDFNPRPDGRYLVKGVLAEGKSAVWIEDAETEQPVTTKVFGSGK